MTTITQLITALPVAPDPLSMTQTEFSAAATATVAAQKAMTPELNIFAEQVNTVAGEVNAHAAAVAADVAQVAADKAIVAADKATVIADMATVAADKATVAADKAIVIADMGTVAADKALTIAARDKAELWADSATEVETGRYSAKFWADMSHAAVTGQLVYRGLFSAAAGTYPTVPTPVAGDFYKISVAGTLGGVAVMPDDDIIYNGATWDVIDNTDANKADLAGNAAQTFSVATATAAAHAVNKGQFESTLTTLFGGLVASNDIGIAGTAGFGVGICPALPAGFTPMAGYNQQNSDNYGNYQYTDGSVMVWIPAFFYKYGTGANGLAVNVVDIKPESAYANEAAANVAGYALHRAFYDGGVVQRGVFVDKYKCSVNGTIASSIKNGIPCSSNAANAPFSACTANGQTPAQFYYGAIAAAKSRGNNFFSSSVFIKSALAMLSYAHAQASTSTTYCAWYHATNNFPKGCNNNALGDANDAALLFTTTGYSTANRTGSANMLAKTTHNGQNCGVADVNGTMWEISLGITSNGTNFYVMKTSAAMKNVTAGVTLATDAWGATGIAALYDNIGATYGALTASSTLKLLGAATQVFDAAYSGNAWNATGAGIPLATGVGGTNPFGNDGIWDYRPNEMCPIVAGSWGNAASAGVGALDLNSVRGDSNYSVGLRAALYL